MSAASILEQSCSDSRRRHEPESGPKLRIRCENTNSRRISASNFIANEMPSSRSISSHVSSPGYYYIRDAIDPSKYSFTTALKALQARSGYSSSAADGILLTLNSKWSDAEKYICNPLSGQVPLECLSARTLSSRSLSTRNISTIYPSHLPKSPTIKNDHVKFTFQGEEKKNETRDVGVQSTPDVTSSESCTYSTDEEITSTTKESQTSSSVSTGKQKPQADQQFQPQVACCINTAASGSLLGAGRGRGRGEGKKRREREKEISDVEEIRRLRPIAHQGFVAERQVQINKT